jgi:lipoate-protein ligase B
VDTTLAPPTLRPLVVRRLGLVPYVEAWELQKRMVAARIAGEAPDTLLLLEHPPVYTLGRNSLEEHILVSPEELARRGASVERIERGGEVTYHGPGQLVAYPIIKLEGAERSVAAMVDNLEQAIIDTLAAYGIPGERLADQRGVWAHGCKIASVGLAVKRWVVMHGMALNVALDLSYFTLINPCGHPETVMTSMEQVLGQAPALDEVGTVFADQFARLFGRTLRDGE